MTPIVLLDTNIWVSAIINPHGYPARLIRAWVDGRFQVIVSVPLLDEIADVLSRPRIREKYGVKAEEITEFLRLLAAQAIKVTPTGQLQICRDPDDDLILETAVLIQAQYVVSRDDDMKRDLELMTQMAARGVTVLTVQQFLDLLA